VAVPEDLFKTLLLPIALITVLFGMGLSLTVEDFRRVILSPKAKLIGLGCQLILLPLLALGLVVLFALPGEIAVGLMLLAACPGGPTSNLISHLSRGDTALSVTLTAVTSVITVFTIPWIVGASMVYFIGNGTAVALPFWKTFAQLFVVTILPIALGMLVKRTCPAFAMAMTRPANILSLVFLGVVVAGAALREENLARQFLIAGPAAVLLNILTMVSSFLTARLLRLSRPQCISISIEGGIQNGTLALAIALGILNSPSIAMPAVVYSLFMFVTGGFMIFRFGRAAS
jgi:BASS family bile acid:Na+ symporter